MRDVSEILGVQLLGLGRNRVGTLLEHDEDVRREQSADGALFFVHFRWWIVGRSFHGAMGRVRPSILMSFTS